MKTAGSCFLMVCLLYLRLECLLMTSRRLDCMGDLRETDMVKSEQRNAQTRVDEGVGFGVPIASNTITGAFRTAAQRT
jgi:hypothetical protein